MKASINMSNDDVIHNYYDNIDWEKEYCDGDIIGKCPICQTNTLIAIDDYITRREK